MRFATRLVVMLHALAFAQPLLAATADDIKALVEKGDARGAYELAKQHPGELGNPPFDFYFGVAAIDSGHAGEGVLALERYVINFPDNLEARLELARGYFVLGEDLRAREEFSGVLKANPPPAVVANVDRYLDALRARESAYQTTIGAFVEFGVGYDTNINGGVSNASINLPNFGLVTLVPAGVKIGSAFGQATGGASITHPLAPGLTVFGSVSADLKAHERHNEFDQGNLGAAGGLSYLKDNNLYRGTLSYSNLQVDYHTFREVKGVAGEWLHQLDELQTVSGSLQYAELAYSGANSVRDSRLYGLGAGYRRSFIGNWSPLFTFSGNYAKEENRRDRDDLSRDIWSARAAVATTPAPKWAVSAGATFQYSHYDMADPLFGTARRDKYYAADFIASYALTRNLSVRGELVLSKNDSNQALFAYDRGIVAMKVRYDFK
jgi:hypothetical protein